MSIVDGVTLEPNGVVVNYLCRIAVMLLVALNVGCTGLRPMSRGQVEARLRSAGVEYVHLDEVWWDEGEYWLTLAGTDASDLRPLVGLPIAILDLGGTPVTDLSPLQNVPLHYLYINNTPVMDLSPLTACRHLHALDIGNTGITNFACLRAIPIGWLDARHTAFSDLSVLAGKHIVTLNIRHTEVKDLRPLADTGVQCLYFSPENITNGMEMLRGLKSLTDIGTDAWDDEIRDDYSLPLDVFWEKYDEGWFKDTNYLQRLEAYWDERDRRRNPATPDG